MDKKFKKPELEIIYFSGDLDTDDVLTVSDPSTDGGNDQGEYGWWS